MILYSRKGLIGNEIQLSKSKISIAISNASEMTTGIGTYFSAVEMPDKVHDVAVEGIYTKQPCDEDDNSHKISLLEECQKESSQQV